MTFTEYQTASKRTMSAKLSPSAALSNYALGLAGETGEVIELVKKALYHGKLLDHDAVAKEIGDVLWYVSALASTLGLNLDEIAQGNVAKLSARYPTSFVQGGGIRE